MTLTRLAAVALALSAPATSQAQGDAFRKLVEIDKMYARGEHAEAIGMLSHWTDHDLEVQVAAVEALFRARERCPECPSLLTGLPLRAAVMLHIDRDRALHYRDFGEEQMRPCPGGLASMAGRYAALLARDPATRDFARRFLLAMAMRCQWDACFVEAAGWSEMSRGLFPGDAEILLTAGSILEERAHAVGLSRGAEGSIFTQSARPFSLTHSPGMSSTRLPRRQDAGDGPKEWLKEARRIFTQVLAIDPDLALARLRLGRLLWRLRELEPAQEALEEAVARLRDPRHAYLAHLFLGRVHEDARRLDQAVAEYRRAVDLDPEAQSGAVALSAGLQQTGDREGSRRALAVGLGEAGRRTTDDPYAQYFVTNAAGLEARFQELRRETAEP